MSTTDVGDRRRLLLLELMGRTCRCGAPKRSRETFCRDCYRALPPPVRRALYRLFSEGYEEAYAEAVAHLGRGDPPPGPSWRCQNAGCGTGAALDPDGECPRCGWRLTA